MAIDRFGTLRKTRTVRASSKPSSHGTVSFPTTIPAWLKRRIPALDWLAHYERKHLRGDALAGVIVATLLMPQAIAYALLAGLPPQVGLYASLLPLAVYALLGSSRYLSVGPSALLSLLILTQVAVLADPGSPRSLTSSCCGLTRASTSPTPNTLRTSCLAPPPNAHGCATSC